MTDAERFAALGAHPRFYGVVSYLINASDRHEGTAYGRELRYLASALLTARARARGRA